jgi:hypothetical protein
MVKMKNSPDVPVSASPSLAVCGMCRSEFEEDRAQPTCQGCPLSRACRFVRCPECGYENPATPSWLKSLRAFVSSS